MIRIKLCIAICLSVFCIATNSYAQTPGYELVLRNDSLVTDTRFEFDIYLQRTGTETFELAQLQEIFTFNTAISTGTLSFTIVSSTSELAASQQPTNARLTIVGNELRIANNVPPGVGSGTIVPPAPGLRVGKFRVTSSVPFSDQTPNLSWKNPGSNPFTRVFAYVEGVNLEITDSTGHLSELANNTLSPVILLSSSPLPDLIAGSVYAETLQATGGTPPYSWTVTSGSLPSGIHLSSSLGILSGTATVANSYQFTVEAEDALAKTDSRLFSLAVQSSTVSRVAFIQQPTDDTAGVPITPPITVQLQDTFGNSVAAADSSVTLSLLSGNGILGGTLTQQTNTTGLAIFNNVSLNLVGVKILHAASGSLTADSSDSFTISAAQPSGMIFVQQPSDVTSQEEISPAVTVQLRDAFGNNAPASNVPVTMSLGNGTGNLSGTLTRLTNASGIATFSDLSVDLAGSKTLLASSNGLTSATSDTFDVFPGVAAQVAFLQLPSNTVAGATIHPPVTAQLQDAAGNPLLINGVAIQLGLLTGSGILSGTLTQQTNASGIASFNDLSVDLSGLKTLVASSSGLSSDTSAGFTISAASAHRLIFVQQPTNAIAGNSISPQVTVRLRDIFGNDVLTSGTSIGVTLSTGTGMLSGTAAQLTDSVGIAHFNNLSINLVGHKQLTASSSGLIGAVSDSFAIAPGTLNNFLVESGSGGTIGLQTAGVPFAIKVTARDASGNTVTDFAGTANITSTAALSQGSGTTAAFTNGVLNSHAIKISNTGAFTLTATRTGNTESGISNVFTVQSGNLHRFAVEADGGGSIETQIAGISLFVEVVALDSMNNTVSGFTGTVSITSSGNLSNGGGTSPSFIAGVLSGHSVTITNSGTFTITVINSFGSETGSSNAFLVNAGEASKLTFVQHPTNAVAGTAISPAVSVRLQDAFDNNVYTANVPIAISLSSGTGILSGTTTVQTDTSGMAFYSGLNINLTGVKQLTATSGGLTPATSNSFIVTAAAANKLAFIQQPTNAAAGNNISPPVTVQVQDSFGNSVAQSGVQILISLSNGTGFLSGTTNQATSSTGLATFNDLSIDLAGSKLLTASTSGLQSAISSAFTITAGLLDNFLIEAQSGGTIPSQLAGTPFIIKMTARDAAGNTVTTFAGTVDITSNGTLSAGSGTTAAFVNGILASHSVRLGAGGTFTVTATRTAGTESGTSNSFTVNYPIPTTASISPATAVQGGNGFVLTVAGTNFFPASVVRFNGLDRTTTFVSDSQIQAAILTSDLTTAGSFPILVFNPTPGGGVSNPQTFTVKNTVANVKVFLEGPYSGGSMTTTLRSSGYLPLSQPYSSSPWNYGGTESIATIPSGIVDWILVELRTGTSGGTRVARRAAFVKSDGTIVDLDGTSKVSFPGVNTGNYYTVIRHRNHISVMSANPVATNDTTALYDFTTGTAKHFGSEAAALPGGKFGMVAGDYSADDFIDAVDFTGPDNELFLDGYRQSDVNMDGFIDAADFAHPDNNIFKGSNVPN